MPSAAMPHDTAYMREALRAPRIRCRGRYLVQEISDVTRALLFSARGTFMRTEVALRH